MLMLPQSSTLEQRNYLFTMKRTGKYCLASVRKKVILQVPAHFQTVFVHMYLFMLLLQNSTY